MLRALDTLEEQTQDDAIREAIAGFAPMSRRAARWSRRRRATRRSSTSLFRAMVRSGEESGRLEDALDRIPYQVEKATRSGARPTRP